jgi:hypothetical protein
MLCFSNWSHGAEAVSSTASTPAPPAIVSAPADATKQNDPVKAALNRRNVALKHVDVRASDGYRTFDVAFKFDPQSPATTEWFHKFYIDVLDANEMHDYAFMDSDDGFLIEVHFDTNSKVLSTNFVPLE